ncbi:MAG: ribosome maturation factor RimP [Bacteroidia bacterium]|jgi:ribosome maturation factor RimP|nr:ribosome maturation factor RimP [Bacteroidia bacterium]
MDIITTLTNWTTAALPEHLFLVGVEQKAGSKKISVFIDGDKGVSIEDCRQLAKSLNAKLDEADYGSEAYMFEVSSPGVDRPLVSTRQYHQHIGRELLVKLTGQNELLGKLERVAEDGVVLLLKDKKKGYKEATEKAVSFTEIVQANVQISFK